MLTSSGKINHLVWWKSILETLIPKNLNGFHYRQVYAFTLYSD